jgi:membrane-bound lytic murein transglycosylase D
VNIAKELRELGLPQDLIAVAFIESGFSADAVSSAGAAGLWQLMPATAKAYGLTIESTVDERVSIWRSTRAAAQHLSDLQARFRSWELALAAYNLGYDGLDRRLDEYDTDDFWALSDAPGALPKETAHYVPKVLAAAVVFENLETFGFGDVERSAPIEASELDVAPRTRLDTVARAAGTSLRILRDLNPELLADVVPDRGDASATIHVPRAGLARARTMLPKLASSDAAPPHVSAEFDWGKDDLHTGRSRLERASTTAESRLGPRRRYRRGLGLGKPAVPSEDSKAKATPARKSDSANENENANATEKEKEHEGATTRLLYRVVAGDSLHDVAKAAGITLDQLLAQAHVSSAADIPVGTLLDLAVPATSAK